jgi:hypothetical protein
MLIHLIIFTLIIIIIKIIIAASGKIANDLTNASWPIGIREMDKTRS